MRHWGIWGVLVAALTAYGCETANGGEIGEGGSGGEGGSAGEGGAGGMGGIAGGGGMGGIAGGGGMGGIAGGGGMGGIAGGGGMGGIAGGGGMGGIAGGGGTGGMPPRASCAAILGDDPAAANGIYTIDPDQSGPNLPVRTYCDMTNPIHGGGWTQLYDQDSEMQGYLPTATWRAGVTNTDPDGGQFSILQLTSEFGQSGDYEFLMDWDDRTNFIKWTQSEDPFIGRGTVMIIDQFPLDQEGCEAADIFSGLAVRGGESTLNGSVVAFCWWWAIGTSVPFGDDSDRIPAYKNSDAGRLDAKRTRLWVR